MKKRLIAAAALALGGAYLAKMMKKDHSGEHGSTVRESIDVKVPVRVAYDQWTQFEEFPSFMRSVHEVKQLDAKRLHWKADVLGKPVEWDAEIVEQVPDQRIAWRSTSGTPNSGVVNFQSMAAGRTRTVLEMTYEPQGAVETVGDALGAVRIEARDNLRRFKDMIEQRGRETGAWRGAVAGPGQPSVH